MFHFKSAYWFEQMEIFLNFFTGYYDQGLYCDNARLIGLSPAYWIQCCFSIFRMHTRANMSIPILVTVTDEVIVTYLDRKNIIWQFALTTSIHLQRGDIWTHHHCSYSTLLHLYLSPTTTWPFTRFCWWMVYMLSRFLTRSWCCDIVIITLLAWAMVKNISLQCV